MHHVIKSYLENSKDHMISQSDQQLGIPQPLIELPYDESMSLIDLVSPKELDFENINLKEVVENRKSVREYENTPLTLKQLSYLLWNTQGVKKHVVRETPTGTINVTFRTVPSAGARNPFETYLLINNVEGIKPGLYRYIALKHKLLPINLNDDIGKKVTEAAFNQEFVRKCAVTFIWVADVYRTEWRYVERALRYIYLDAGHVCQNLYLTAESIQFGACAIGAFNDDEMLHTLGLNHENLFVTYMAAVGKKLS